MHRGLGLGERRRLLVMRQAACLSACLVGAGLGHVVVLADTVDNMVIEKNANSIYKTDKIGTVEADKNIDIEAVQVKTLGLVEGSQGDAVVSKRSVLGKAEPEGSAHTDNRTDNRIKCKTTPVGGRPVAGRQRLADIPAGAVFVRKIVITKDSRYLCR